MKVTRDVISDLWPLYASGEATADTRALVEEFLGGDREFASLLRQREPFPASVPPELPMDHEAQAFSRLRQRLRGYPWLLQLAMLFSGLAFGRIISDTSWDVSPRNFIINAAIAAAFWIAYFVSLWRMRATILIVPGRRRKS